MNNWSKIIQKYRALGQLLPCYCVLCLKVSRRDISICAACEQQLPWLKNPCLQCAQPIACGERTCGRCLTKKPAFDRLQALFHYAPPVDCFIRRLKYHAALPFAKLFARLLLDHLIFNENIDCILSVPLFPLRQQRRGFNQTGELARIIGREKGVPVDKWNCLKIKDTFPQSQLSAKRRQQNIPRSAFRVQKGFSAKQVLIVEDVVTTGATLNAMSQALKGAGVSTVEVWSCCRTDL